MDWLVENWDLLLRAAGQHVVLVFLSLTVALALALAIGIAVRRRPRIAAVVGAVSGLLYTIPALALFAVLVPIVGLGTVPAVIGLTTYALLILTRNVAAGFQQVPASVIDAAVAMGMAPGSILWRIELPLALPVIIAGLRVASTTTISAATIAAYINAGGLGAIILTGIQQAFALKIAFGALVAAALAIGVDLALASAERHLQARGATS
ncbi:MAG: ABC transporter permease [Alphaproteobacteria bacterium]|nr:ABC transporter permease [Alphaproteobacteria bacterium]